MDLMKLSFQYCVNSFFYNFISKRCDGLSKGLLHDPYVAPNSEIKAHLFEVCFFSFWMVTGIVKDYYMILMWLRIPKSKLTSSRFVFFHFVWLLE